MKFRITSPHYNEEDKLIEASEDKPVEIGTGTMYKWTRPPTLEMEPLDEEARAAIEVERERVGGRSSDPLDDLPMTLEPKDQLRLILQNLNPEEVRNLLEEEIDNLPPIVRGKKI